MGADARRTKNRARSILSVCEQLGYRSATQQMPHFHNKIRTYGLLHQNATSVQTK